MKIKEIGKRGLLFTFSELLEMGCTTNVYVIIGNKYIFICDTYLGPVYMEEIKNYICSRISQAKLRNIADGGKVDKPFVIFNSHSDWDHVWGNSAFSSSVITAHEKCRENMEVKWEEAYLKYQKFAKGMVEKVLPDLTFTRELDFPDEGIKFFYTPGHTRDSASCLDVKEKILFAGDNVEAPHPYFQPEDKNVFISTLKKYLDMDLKQIIPGHGEPCGKEMVRTNIEYIKSSD